MATITFLPEKRTVEGAKGESLFDVARRHGIEIDTACVGKATCGLCRVRILSGGNGLTPYSDAEKKHIGNVYFITRTRLACCSRIESDDEPIVVEPLPPTKKRSSQHRLADAD